MPPRLLSKVDVAHFLLATGKVSVHLDPRRDGVVLPPLLKRSPVIKLVIGYGLPIPIPDLAVTDLAITGTLNYRGAERYTVVPWRSVYALVGEKDQRAVFWPENAPKEFALVFEDSFRTIEARAGHLRLVREVAPCAQKREAQS